MHWNKSNELFLKRFMTAESDAIISTVAKGTVQCSEYCTWERDIIELTEEVTDAGSFLTGENCKSLKSVHCPLLLIFQNPYLNSSFLIPFYAKWSSNASTFLFKLPKFFVIFKWASITWPIGTFFTGSPLEIMNLIF